jgi:hypothetical protein
LAIGFIERRRLRQASEHRSLGERELVERLAVIGLRGCGEAVSALPEVDLVHVQLEDLLLGQAVLDLEGEQRLVELAREGLLRREEEVARHLHGDGARSLPPPARYQVRPGRAHHTDIVDPRVLVEAFVLGRDHRVLELLRVPR